MICPVDHLAKIKESLNELPVFDNLNQCLWVCYSMEVAKASPKTTLMKLLRDLNDGNYAEKVSLKRIDWGGCDLHDQYAQGVYVRSQVDELLDESEADYVKARFSWTDEKTKSASRLAGVLYEAVLSRRDRKMAIPIVWYIVGPPKDREKVSPDIIARKHQLSIRTAQRDIEISEAFLNGVWSGARRKLQNYFEQNLLIRKKHLKNDTRYDMDVLELAELGKS